MIPLRCAMLIIEEPMTVSYIWGNVESVSINMRRSLQLEKPCRAGKIDAALVLIDLGDEFVD